MKSFRCNCGNLLFFDSLHCVQCKSTTLICPTCSQLAPSNETTLGIIVCGSPDCGQELRECGNSTSVVACNHALVKNDSNPLCEFCRTTKVTPDLSVPGNGEKWQRLENAKHRVLQTLKEIGFQLNSKRIPLTFHFKEDADKPVMTGHKNGCITINICEADSVEREKTRVQFGEPQRTLVGHFRHELGHYYWDLLVKDQRIDEFRSCFGNETNPSYKDAMSQYYEDGPISDWSLNFISPYATMHPWEDFAETFGAYLDMQSVLSTAEHFGLVNQQNHDIQAMIASYGHLGMIVNELNRDMGLTDLVPEIFNAGVVAKLSFIDRLRSRK